MSGRKGKGSKAKIQISKPELPPFLQRMKEQIVANEDADRKEQSERKRKERPGTKNEDQDDDPTIVKLGDEDLTEEEYKRMKKDLLTQYKLDNDRTSSKPVELNIDDMIQTRKEPRDLKTAKAEHSAKSSTSTKPQVIKSAPKVPNKKLSYDSSSSEAEDD